MPCTDGSAASASTASSTSACDAVSGSSMPNDRIPASSAFLCFDPHVDLARLVDADEHRRQAHRRRSGRLDLAAQPSHDLVAEPVAVHQHRATRRALELHSRLRGTDGHQLNPTISPFSSKSMIAAAGWPPRPGIVRISPQIGYTKPAPTDALTSRTLSV